ncbi:ferric reductase-like transmembrane domain-containing protein [Paraburkholderia kirstenboschensis]|uniref:ferric reductase-like transmembrane domain-containing protein n=1 Tax=Paraburkholderia kirstenboschensis TaxID=1245436 RepID=UPI001F212E47|nr:ferric reductase-like transmembrane domain-containing protein [Paraburkholderia kirstenboschensis]
MKNIRLAYLTLVTGMALLWLFADGVLSAPYEFRAFQLSMINFTGILTIECMSAGMFLSIRPTSVEPFLGGLDKSYRLHKWLGVSALVLSTLHWLWVKAPSWLIGLGWMQRPSRKLDLSSGETLSAIAQMLSSQRGLARSIGEWAFYAAVALIIVALLRRFPYRYFFKTHRLLAVSGDGGSFRGTDETRLLERCDRPGNGAADARGHAGRRRLTGAPRGTHAASGRGDREPQTSPGQSGAGYSHQPEGPLVRSCCRAVRLCHLRSGRRSASVHDFFRMAR